MVIIRLFGMLFIFLTVVYICLSLYSRAVRKDKLEEEWFQEGQPGEKDAFIKAGLKEYNDSLRKKLLLGVYVIPFSLIAIIIYVQNWM
ncbi:hypothetical protein [Cognatishimia sp. MH4019]|uniref:hypothetical protein n=1 Tax=Cognatishimia sp. MH4019 TaxID=2854030 RepID=UPI001CD7EEDA|nr:hypothetical protein [Cognatishimia sp. MH4019]